MWKLEISNQSQQLVVLKVLGQIVQAIGDGGIIACKLKLVIPFEMKNH
jgi:hypothetical protein